MTFAATAPAPRQVAVGKVRFGADLPFVLIAGPCALESRDHAMMIADRLHSMTAERSIPLIFKASFDKANRTSGKSARGTGIGKAGKIFAEIREQFGIPTLTDIHEPAQCQEIAPYVDILQIPAFLCRQTDLVVAAARTGRAVNIKKGQFLAPWDMKHVAAKVTEAGNPNVLVTERGVSFGYNTLVTDFRSLPQMAEATGAPVIFDATHSVQQPSGLGGASGGQREFVAVLARAALAIGVAGLFIETHEAPERAPSDGPNMVPLDAMPDLLDEFVAFDRLAKQLSARKSKA